MVSHDRYFTDKVCDRVFAFEGEGVVRDFPGNYTQYRNYVEEQEELKQQQKESSKSNSAPQASAPSNAGRNSNRKRKLTFGEKRELEQLEKDIDILNQEKTEIEIKLSSGAESADSIVQLSNRYTELKDELDEKELRWLELSDI